jgi:hypothetical protein
MEAGETSAMYIGDSTEANPIPIPPNIRYIMKSGRAVLPASPNEAYPNSGIEDPIPDIVNKEAARSNPLFLPKT